MGFLSWFRSKTDKSWDLDHGGWIDASAPLNFWQAGFAGAGVRNEVVYACVQAYARTIAQLPGQHLRRTSGGYDVPVTDSALYRVLHRPNAYQSRSDFLLNLVCSLLYDGNAYVLGLRDNRGRIATVHLLPPAACSPHVADGEIFYHVAPDDVTGESPMLVPARDVAHVRLHTPSDPLVGETPIVAAALSVKVNNNITGHQSKFFENMSRPSGVIETDQQLKPEQIQQFREKWEAQSSGLNSGGVPLLAWGFKWKPLSLNSVDAQLIEAQKMSVERIAAVYGVPLPLIGVLDQASYSNVFNLMNFWKANGLGFVLEHVEQALGILFNLPNEERLELDTNKLMRTDLAARYDALTKGITGGLLAPNEGRRMEGLRPVDGGDMPRVQQQMVPLDYEEPEPVPGPPVLDAGGLEEELERRGWI